jgi:phenylacetate-CoA ligase
MDPATVSAARPADFRPRFAGDDLAETRRLLRVLENTQWQPPEQIRELQFALLRTLAAGALRHIPLYRERLERARSGSGLSRFPEAWPEVQLLTRDGLLRNFEQLLNPSLGDRHGPLGLVRTSGSTGLPVQVRTTAVTRLWWNVFMLREHQWHQRAFRLKLAAIRNFKSLRDDTGTGRDLSDWGPPFARFTSTGPGAILNVQTPVSMQLQWLARQQPHILVTYPSNAVELARQSLAQSLALPSLREVMLIGESAGDETRLLCREAWNVRVTDVYAANEVGYIAVQCPQQQHYHVQSENLLVEVLDDAGRPCREGETGRLVVTTLHNYANPLLRYEIGDYAEVGGPCPCGRGLPVLKRILGRTRNMLTLPTGERCWPRIGGWSLRRLAPVVQSQFIQRSLEEIEVRMVTERALSGEELEKLRDKIHEKLRYPFRLEFVFTDRLERSPGGKFEEFKSLLTDG